MLSNIWTWLARLFMLVAFSCGVVGLIAALIDREWKLGATGWFTGGTLLAVIALVILADQFVTSRRQS